MNKERQEKLDNLCLESLYLLQKRISNGEIKTDELISVLEWCKKILEEIENNEREREKDYKEKE